MSEALCEPLAVLAARAACALEHSIQHLVVGSGQNLGHLEVQAARDVQELLRQTIERGAQARQRLDFYPAVQHLAAVGRALFGENQAKLKPLVKQLKNPSSLKVIRQLEAVLAVLPDGTAGQTVAKEVEYFHEHQERMNYRAGRRAGEPIGSGPVEAACRQTQCRFKRPGPFWSQAGDEALLGLEMFWRNGRWHLLFPHTIFNPARN